jgi:DNA-binding NarL/FixJ family response regulator
MNKPRVLLADDHTIVLQGLIGLLRDTFDLVGTASDGLELVEQARALRPDVIVADVSMPLLNGIEACRKLRDQGVDAKVVFLTMHSDAVYATRALDAGATGYVLKHAASEELVAAIHAALRDERFLSAQLATPAMQEFLDAGAGSRRRTIDLTDRQRDVLKLLAEGKSAKEVGAILNISARTVETHKYKMMDALGVKTTAQLVQHAVKHGLVTP